MDKHFLEFWGHALLHAAKSQKQIEDLAKNLPQAIKGGGFIKVDHVGG